MILRCGKGRVKHLETVLVPMRRVQVVETKAGRRMTRL